MKIDDVRRLTPDQLTDQLLDLKKEQVLARLGRGEDVDASEYTFRTSTRIEAATSQLEKSHRVQVVRRDIARIKTVLGSRAPRAQEEKKKKNA